MKSKHSPNVAEMSAVINAYFGWADVDGLGPRYFADKEVEDELYALLTTGKPVTERAEYLLAQGRARIVNFNRLISGADQGFQDAAQFIEETRLFLSQLRHQMGIWDTA